MIQISKYKVPSKVHLDLWKDRVLVTPKWPVRQLQLSLLAIAMRSEKKIEGIKTNVLWSGKFIIIK